ncbi:MAG TPA: hypothetical protein VFC19_04230 [Candidatus Limnocylindrales bacterium]|nr:hypothetical protein [Candidatus Limnocylindrales bacterium]
MTTPVTGPWKVLSDPDGLSTPFYVIPFDRDGVCTGPNTLDHLVEASTNCTDVFVFSHGWNNDWDAATKRYEDFATEFTHARRKGWRPSTRDYNPLLVGVFWPSTSLVLPWERPPDIAGAPSSELDEVAALAEDLGPREAGRLHELASAGTLDRAQAGELAEILAPLLGGEQDELDPGVKPPTADELFSVWREAPGLARRRTDGGFIDDVPVTTAAGGPQAAGFLDRFDPRNLIRGATVVLMKDRAGRVGAAGVAVMLRRIVDASPDSRVHLVGHSYGAKVVLSALCHGEAPGRAVDSVLLLQPAMSCLCFASNVDNGRPGGYRPALERSRGPIVTTFSPHDAPLTTFFHLAVRRRSDLGEAVIAGGPPSRYAALGGYGPQGARADTEIVTARLMPQRYGFTATGKRIIAIDGTGLIMGHGDVTTPVTAWALLNQVME